MKKALAVLVMLLLVSTVAYAGTSIRGGAVYGNYDYEFGPTHLTTKGPGAYIGLTGYLSDLPVGFTGSYSMTTASSHTVSGLVPVADEGTFNPSRREFPRLYRRRDESPEVMRAHVCT